MANSSSVSSKDSRNNEPYVKPVWEIVTTFIIEADGGATELSQNIDINGSLKEMTIEVGAATGITGTVNVALASAQDAALFSEGGLADATTHLKQALSKGGSTDADFNPALADGTITLTGTLSGNPSTSGGTIDVTVFYR